MDTILQVFPGAVNGCRTGYKYVKNNDGISVIVVRTVVGRSGGQ
jgi:hypothetical protein